jgi:FtsP/CotA-like multicopper oxidase with cupredoxin domain
MLKSPQFCISKVYRILTLHKDSRLHNRIHLNSHRYTAVVRSLALLHLMLLLLVSPSAWAALVEYQLDIRATTMIIGDKSATAMLVNDSYPGPVLRFREGDTARITVTNYMDVDSSVHWHGLLVPSDQDGVPYLSSLPIKPGGSLVYEFPLKHAGTYWYHSHTDLQEQSGVHGGIVVEAASPKAYDYEKVLVLQDWTHENPHDVLANLKKDGDYYALKKDSVVSIAGYLERGVLGDWWQRRWQRMGGMDVSDVAYDAFLINGQQQQQIFPKARPGERIRLRFINAGASTYFLLHSAGLEFEVIAADGLDVKAVNVDEVLHAVAETYDIVVTVPESGSLELRASAQDGSGFASVFVGGGEPVAAIALPKPDLYGSHDMDGMGEMDGMQAMEGHAHHAMQSSMQDGPRRLNYEDLQNLDQQSYAGGSESREVELRLTGNMETYNWSFNNIPLSRADKLLVQRGETVRFKFVNETMMHHPLHLHGHFFRVLNEQGTGPFKHTVDVPPMQTVTIEFLANEERDWFFHCHNLYHAKTGMARVVRYEDYQGSPEFEAGRKASADIKDSDFYHSAELKVLDDFGRASGWLANNQHRFELDLESRDWDESRGEATYLYRLNRWTQLLGAVEKEKDEDVSYALGVRYVLPLLVDMDLFITDEGEVEAEFETEFQLSKRVQMHWEYETTGRYHFGLEYRFDEALSLEGAYTSDVDFAVGLKLRL